jgi:2-iminobutanoate/2-iminopropanoate deaminase
VKSVPAPGRQAIETSLAPAAIGPYSQAIQAGSLIFVSGQIPLDPGTGRLVDGGISRETEQVFDNIAAILGAAGVSLDQVVKTTVYLVSLDDFAAMNEVYARRVGSPEPARSTVGVLALPRGARVEIEAIASR